MRWERSGHDVGARKVDAKLPGKGDSGARKVDVRLPGKGDSKSHGARPVHLVMTMIKGIRTSRLPIRNYLCWS